MKLNQSGLVTPSAIAVKSLYMADIGVAWVWFTILLCILQQALWICQGPRVTGSLAHGQAVLDGHNL